MPLRLLFVGVVIPGCFPRTTDGSVKPEETGIGEDTDADSGDDAETEGDSDEDSASDTGPCMDGEVHSVSVSGLDLRFVRLCAATFEVGCTPAQEPECNGSQDEIRHAVTLTHDTRLGAFEVTQSEFTAVMGYDPSSFSGGSLPVESVSWSEAAAFANALSEGASLEACYACRGSGSSTSCSPVADPYTCPGFRLPTEAEWEGAARCGRDETYAGSGAVGDVAWYASNSGSTTHAVGEKDANACGTYDMSGNVWEWAHDLYAPYTSASVTDPPGGTTGTDRMLRGGNWGNNAASVRVAYRIAVDPGTVVNGIGFRLRGPESAP